MSESTEKGVLVEKDALVSSKDIITWIRSMNKRNKATEENPGGLVVLIAHWKS